MGSISNTFLPKLGVPISVGNGSYTIPTSYETEVDSNGSMAWKTTFTTISEPTSIPAWTNGTGTMQTNTSWLPASHTYTTTKTYTIPPVNIPSNGPAITKIYSHLEAFISDHPDRAYVTDRGHGPLPFSALEEAYKDIKFVLVKLQGVKGGWRSSDSINYLYDGLYCFFTREKDQAFEWQTYENFRTITMGQGRGGIAAVGKMSCLMTADMIFDPYADLIRQEFFRQFPNGEFDSRSHKLNQRVFFIRPYSETSGNVFRFVGRTEVYTSGTSYVDNYGGYHTNTTFYDSPGMSFNPIFAFAYFTGCGIELFTGIDETAGWFNREWVNRFLRTFYPISENGEEIEKKRHLDGEDGMWTRNVGDTSDEILYEGRILQYTSSIPVQLMPSAYFKSSALLTMLLTNFLYTWVEEDTSQYKTKTNNFPSPFYEEDPVTIKMKDKTDVAFFKWLFKSWDNMNAGALFSRIAYESQNHIIYREDENGSIVAFDQPISIDLSKYEKNDEFILKEKLQIVHPSTSMPIPEGMTISSI